MTERNFTILSKTITTSVSIVAVEYGDIPISTTGLTVQTIFTYGTSGTTVKAFLQTSFDDGTTWVDIASFSFTTTSATNLYNLSTRTPKTSAVVPTDGTLGANSVVDGLIGHKLRAKYVTTGTYATSTTLKMDIKLHS